MIVEACSQISAGRCWLTPCPVLILHGPSPDARGTVVRSAAARRRQARVSLLRRARLDSCRGVMHAGSSEVATLDAGGDAKHAPLARIGSLSDSAARLDARPSRVASWSSSRLRRSDMQLLAMTTRAPARQMPTALSPIKRLIPPGRSRSKGEDCISGLSGGGGSWGGVGGEGGGRGGGGGSLGGGLGGG